MDLVKGKLAERNDPLADHYVTALNELTFDSEDLSIKVFMKEVARHEKHLITSFVSQLYLQLDDFKEDPEGDIAK